MNSGDRKKNADIGGKAEQKRPFYKRTDIVIIAVVLFACIFSLAIRSFIGSSAGANAEIYKDSRLIKTVGLSKPQEFNIDGVIFKVKDGKIRFEKSDCPDELCVSRGYIGKINDIAVCIPNKMYIKITGASGSKPPETDIIAE